MKNNLWNVMTFKCGTCDRDSANFTGALHAGVKYELQFWCTALWNDEHKILIDTGLKKEHRIPTYTNVPNNVTDEQVIVNQIKNKLGWETDDVDIIINTHLHYDHCGYNDQFKNAKFYVQSLEWKDANNPHPSYAVVYYPETFGKKAVSYFDWIFVDGEADVLPGIKLIPTPGHTLGHQSVLVNTSEGVLCVAGDAVNCLESLRLDLANGTAMDNVKQHETNQLIKRLADCVLSSHEEGPEMYEFQTSNFPRI